MMNQNTNTTTTNKMTYVKALEAAVACEALSAEVREKLEALKEQQVKRNSAEKKPTKVQQANESYKSLILEVLRGLNKPVTISELMQAHEELSPVKVSPQKISALVSQMVKSDLVVRTEEKRKAYFTAVK